MEQKEQLKQNLIKYKSILNKSMYDYLNSLLELEFSVLKEKISANDRGLLKELAIYKQIFAYNISNRALKIIEEANIGISLEISFYESYNSYISLPFGEDSINLFSFSFLESIPPLEKGKKLGIIHLYKSIYDPEVNKQILEETYKELEILNKSFKNGIKCLPFIEEANHYKFVLNRLNSKKELTKEEKSIIEITSTIHSLLLEEYGIKEGDLIKRKDLLIKEIDSIESQPERAILYGNYGRLLNYLSKSLVEDNKIVLVKRLSDVDIESNIRYIL